ncbi:hypothetical protein BDI4_1200029 [Burkholderia diffusa]|nr:hypothetical protein BDI4_1200029 [Burkholderia diffusa]
MSWTHPRADGTMATSVMKVHARFPLPLPNPTNEGREELCPGRRADRMRGLQSRMGGRRRHQID